MKKKTNTLKNYISKNLGESRFFRIPDVGYEQQEETDESDLEVDMELEDAAADEDLDAVEDAEGYDELEDDFDDEVDDFDDEVDDSFEEEPEDPDRQGLIRTVDNAHLIYKRKSEDGTFEELWIYNIGVDFGPDTKTPFADEMEVRNDILASTDIDNNDTESEDRTQSYTLTTMGNAQFMHVTGLPN